MDGMQQLAALAGASGLDLRTLAQLFQAVGAQNSRDGQDTILAHINPQEYQMLLQQGGSGRPDPMTGLPHFDRDSDSGGDGSDGGGGRSGGDSGGSSDADGGGSGSGGGYGGGGPNSNGAGPMGGENAATGENSSSTAGRDAAYGGGWGGDGAVGGGDVGVSRTSTSLSPSDLSALGLSGYQFGNPTKATDDFSANSFGLGMLGLTPGTVASAEGLLAGSRARDAAIGFSPTALGLDVVGAVTGLPAGLMASAVGLSPKDYSVVANLGDLSAAPGAATGGASYGLGGSSGSGAQTPVVDPAATDQASTTAQTTPAAQPQSILSVLQSLFGADKVYGVRS